MDNAAIAIVEYRPGYFNISVHPTRSEAIAWAVDEVSNIGGVSAELVDAKYDGFPDRVCRTVFVVSDDTPVSGVVFGPHSA